jgi:hypothetical protein
MAAMNTERSKSLEKSGKVSARVEMDAEHTAGQRRQGEREEYIDIDIAKGIGICLIVLGHQTRVPRGVSNPADKRVEVAAL